MGMANTESSRKIVYLIDEAVNAFAKTAIWGKLEETRKYRRVLSPGTYQTRVMKWQSTYIPLNGLIELSLLLLLRGAVDLDFDQQPLFAVSITRVVVPKFGLGGLSTRGLDCQPNRIPCP